MRYKRPDIKNALSIIESAKRDMNFTLHSIEVTEESGTTIIRNIYESFRMLGDALLTAKGISAADHIEQIKELLKLNVKTSRPIQLIDNLRQLRHNLNYYGYRPSLIEIKDIVSLAKSCFDALYSETDKIIKSI
jgi:hypothetical protein